MQSIINDIFIFPKPFPNSRNVLLQVNIVLPRYTSDKSTIDNEADWLVLGLPDI